MTITLAPITLGGWERVVRACEGDPDDVLFGREALPEGAATALVVVACDVADGSATMVAPPEGGISPAELLAEALPGLTARYVAEAQRHAQEAMELAGFYAERSGGVGGGSGAEISLARLVSREKPADWLALRSMPLVDCLLYLFMRGVDAAAEEWNDA